MTLELLDVPPKMQPLELRSGASLRAASCSPPVPRCADLFCCAGGAGMGISRAGFDVEGWDVKTGLNYPFKRHIGCALDADLTGFDFVWASPPCQAHTTLKHVTGKEYECYIERTREKLKAWGGLYIIENVVGAPLQNPVMLCGSSFGLRVRRHRIFESNVLLTAPECNHAAQPDPIDVSGTGSFQHSPRKKKTGGLGTQTKRTRRSPRNHGHAVGHSKGNRASHTTGLRGISRAANHARAQGGERWSYAACGKQSKNMSEENKQACLPENAVRLEWEALVSNLDTSKWTVADRETAYAFFCHGWFGRTCDAAYQAAGDREPAMSKTPDESTLASATC